MSDKLLPMEETIAQINEKERLAMAIAQEMGYECSRTADLDGVSHQLVWKKFWKLHGKRFQFKKGTTDV